MKMTIVYLLTGLGILLGVSACAQTNGQSVQTIDSNQEYGVFLSLKGREAVDAGEGFETVVIDAQNLSSDEIAEMQARGQEVYSYINVGSLETFRPYYEEFQHLTLKPYENWENEFWMDVSDEEWRDFTTGIVADQLLEKGIDGFWVDNVDVYWQFQTEDMYAGVEEVLKSLMSHGKPVVINGGDKFIRAYLEQNNQVDDILTGVNQETVFSAIHFQDRSLGTQNEESRSYYLRHLDDMEQAGKDIFLLEYTTDSGLAEEIDDYATERGWKYYISDSIELDGN